MLILCECRYLKTCLQLQIRDVIKVNSVFEILILNLD